MSIRRIGVAAFVAMVVPLGALSAAWACTTQPQVFSVNPLVAMPGTEARVVGEAMTVQGPVELRWNGVAGPKLAAATVDAEGSFALTFTVPDVGPGIYTLLVAAGDAGVGRTVFEVAAAPGRTAPDGVVSADAPARGFTAASDAASLDVASSGSFAALAAGVGLLAFGTATLLAGFAVATVRRRRAHATHTSS